MITKKMQAAIEEHVGAEIESAYLYLGMSAYCEAKAFKGFGRWLRVQFQEEMEHATKMVDYLLSQGCTVSFRPVAAPPAEHGTLLQVFEQVLAHEKDVTKKVHALHGVAVAESDLATQLFLQWFVTEQVEEEALASEIVDKLRMVADRLGSALYLDKEYGKRGRS